MLLKDFIHEGIQTLSSLYPEHEAREMIFVCLEHFLGTSRHTHILEPSFTVSPESVRTVRAAFRRMASGEPLQYVTGRAYFYGREFNVSPSVLIPRPETEILCREVCNAAGAMKILDLCTGSGCIAWTLALENPGAEITAVDISDEALDVASKQDFCDEIARTGASVPVFVKADVLAEPSLPGIGDGYFDILVSNPPYVMDSEKVFMRSNVLDHEPHLALFVPDTDPLLFYRAIAGWALRFLKPAGFAIVEINEALGLQTAELYRTAGFSDVRILQDLSGRDRFVSFRK